MMPVESRIGGTRFAGLRDVIEKAQPSSLTPGEVLDRILDKGIVIDAVTHVSVVGTELVTVRSSVVVASIETYIHYFGEDADASRPDPERLRASRQANGVADIPEFLPD
jgi:hypothetical protein